MLALVAAGAVLIVAAGEDEAVGPTDVADLMTAANDPDSHAIQREMAAEWLKLADAILCPLKADEII